MPARHHDQLTGLYREISWSVDAILHNLPALSVDMRHRALGIARELLLVQSHVIDKVAHLSDIPATFDRRVEEVDRSPPQASAHHLTFTAWLNQCTCESAEPVASSTAPGIRALSNRVAPGRGLSAISTDWRSPDDRSELARVGSELRRQVTTPLARLPLTLVGSDYASGAVSSEAVRDTLDEAEWLKDGEIVGPAIKLKSVIESFEDRVRAWPTTAMAAAVIMGASLMLLFGAPGAPRIGPSGGSASSATEERRSAAAVDARPLAEVASNEATPRTDEEAAANGLREKFQSRLSASVRPLTATDADPSSDRVSASENAVDVPTGALVIEPPRDVSSTLADVDPATPPVGEHRALASDEPLSASAIGTSFRRPPQKVSIATSTEVPAPPISEARNGMRPSVVTLAKPTLQRPPREEEPTRQSNHPTTSALQPRPAAAGITTAKAWQTATVAEGHFAPVLLTLNDKAAALQIFEDLQKRHAAILGSKKAELRSFLGSDGQTWYHVAALPAGTEAEAKEICHALGPESEALDCTVAPE